jgi:hypothetical protein
MKAIVAIFMMLAASLTPFGENSLPRAEKGHFLVVHSGDLMGYLEECG